MTAFVNAKFDSLIVVRSGPEMRATRRDRIYENSEYLRGTELRGRPMLTVTIPSYLCDASALLDRLAMCRGAHAIEAVIYDDGSADDVLDRRHAAAAERAGFPVRIFSAAGPIGRANARNRAIEHARADWVLFLDADTLPDDIDFLARYADAIRTLNRPGVICGGLSLAFAPTDRRFALHRWQSARFECVPASRRGRAPGRYVSAGNVAVHRQVLDECPFDGGFYGWGLGWEDVDWGLRLQKRTPIMHIDNPATHLGLETAATLMARYSRSGDNFARVCDRHRFAMEQTGLYILAQRLRQPGVRGFIPLVRAAAGVVARDPLGITPVALRGCALRLWRAAIYAAALHKAG